MEKEITDDLTSLLHLLSQVMSDTQDQTERLVAWKFINQEGQYFQKLLAALFQSFLALKSTGYLIKDCELLRLAQAFVHCFSIMMYNEEQKPLCKEQALRFLVDFLSDADLVEKCQIDLSSSANSEETDPDTDDELKEIQSESEPLRLEVIKLLSLALIDIQPKSKDSGA